jgi:hypothetical protein
MIHIIVSRSSQIYKAAPAVHIPQSLKLSNVLLQHQQCGPQKLKSTLVSLSFMPFFSVSTSRTCLNTDLRGAVATCSCLWSVYVHFLFHDRKG